MPWTSAILKHKNVMLNVRLFVLMGSVALRHYGLGIALICVGIASAVPAAGQLAAGQQAGATVAGARFFVTGDPAKPRPATPSQGLMLMGGGDWDKQAFQWWMLPANQRATPCACAMTHRFWWCDEITLHSTILAPSD